MNQAQRLLVMSLCVVGAMFSGWAWYVVPLARHEKAHRDFLEAYNRTFPPPASPEWLGESGRKLARSTGEWVERYREKYAAPETRTENILLGMALPVALLGGALYLYLGAKKGPPLP
jgi:hypothetical protein